jgi:hypothetical protein
MAILNGVTSADLRRLLAEAEATEAEAATETPHTVLLADLADHRVQPGQLADTLKRIFDAFELLGVDLLADGGPARKVKAKATAKATTDDDTKEGATP